MFHKICQQQFVKLTSLRTIFFAGLAAASFGLFMPGIASATVLPDPSTIVDGLPVFRPFDQFLSFSAHLLELFGFPGFDAPTGTGGLDILLYTGSHGANNLGVGTSHTFNFEDPQVDPGGSNTTFSGTWGAGTAAVNGPVLVDNLLDYLHAQFGPTHNIPVFTFDMNQTGNNLNLALSARVTITDPANGNAIIASWSLDGNPPFGTNGIYEPGSPAIVEGSFCLTGLSSTLYCVDNNKGSGKMDFLEYAPTMDLSLYAGHGYEFHGLLEMSGLNDALKNSSSRGLSQPTQTLIPPVSLSLRHCFFWDWERQV